MRILKVGGVTMLILLSGTVPRCGHASAAQVIVQWTAPADDGSDCTTGPATRYDVRYSVAALNESTWAAATKAAGIDAKVPAACGSTEEFAITGLASNARYYVAVKAVDEAGNWSPISNVIQITTPDLTSPAAATDFRQKP